MFIEPKYESNTKVSGRPIDQSACSVLAIPQRRNSVLKKPGTADSSLVLAAQAGLRTARNDKEKDLATRVKPGPSKLQRTYSVKSFAGY
jgi:hypothetical protein